MYLYNVKIVALQSQSYLSLCHPMNCSTPAFSVLCYLLEFAHFMSVESGMLSAHLTPCHPLLLFLQSWPALLFSVAKLCLTLCDPMDSNPPGFSTHGILQERKWKWVAIPFSKGSAQPRDQTWVSCITGSFFIIWVTREAHNVKICNCKVW